MRRIAALIAIFVAAPAVGPAVQHTPLAPATATAKTCSAGFKHAVIRGSEKCLRRGQFCARAADGQYRRYGFRCTKRDVRGNYHLT